MPQDIPSPFPAPAQPVQQPPPVQLVPTPQQSPPAQLVPTTQQPPPAQPAPIHITSMGGFIRDGSFIRATDLCRAGKITTGFPGIDQEHPFRPGLHVIGGTTGLGKSALALQLATQIAEAGAHVLYYASELSPLELTSRALARTCYILQQEDIENNNGAHQYQALSGADIRFEVEARSNITLATALNRCSTAVGDRLTIIDGPFSLGIDDIIAQTNHYIEETGIIPVVIIDYVQLVKPTQITGHVPDSKTAMDEVIHKLKVFQLKHNSVMILLSSLNRDSYFEPVSTSSYKESGSFEYSVDQAFGLQLSAFKQDNFNYTTDAKGHKKARPDSEKRQILLDAMTKNPREVDLVCLKNRNGPAGYVVHFDYYPASDFFEERP